MARPEIQLEIGLTLPILYEDHAVLAIDKPAGWLLVPEDWTRTSQNLLLELMTSVKLREFWARSRNIRFIRNVHRLDRETSGVLVLAKTHGALTALGELFETRQVEKFYLAVVTGSPTSEQWVCSANISPEPKSNNKMRVDRHGKEAITEFRVLQRLPGKTLIEAHPLTGRTHQIRLHLADAGFPVAGDTLYGRVSGVGKEKHPFGLRAVALRYRDPFRKKAVFIQASTKEFRTLFGFPDKKES